MQLFKSARLAAACLFSSGAFAAVAAGAAQAEPIEFFQVEGVSYDSSVPAPESFFGFGLGDRPVRHDQMVEYLSAIAAESDRISMEVIGRSHEGRPILFFVVTSPDNHARIDEIRAAHLASLDSGEPTGGPAVVWMNFGVHGAESTGMDAAIPSLYHMAAAQGPEMEATLDGAVILITAIFNPDGHSRRVNHVYTYAGEQPVSDPAHAQHDIWVEARTNHYWFDLNRQWLLQTQPESRAWMEAWHRWKPMVSADFHEMGTESTFYFHPGEPRRRNPLIPERARELTFGIAERHVEFFDGEARLFSSEEGFDNFYVGKGSTYPQVNGGLGILYEIGAARGGLIEAARGEVSYADNIRTQFRISLTTVQGALDQADEIAAYQREFFATALEAGGDDRRRGYVFTAEGDPRRAELFADLMRRHDIDVYRLAEDVRADGRTYRAGEAYVIPLEQDQYTMIRAAFDRVTRFEEAIFYDVSGWTLPLAYDLDYANLSRAWSNDLLGERFEGAGPAHAAAPDVASYGYMFRWSDYLAPRALYRVLDEDLRVRVATRPTTVETSRGEIGFQRGSVFIPFVGQEMGQDEIHALMSEIARDTGIEIHAISSGFTPTPGADLGGSRSFRAVQRPEVMVLFDGGLARYDSGEAWHALDQRMGVRVTLRRKTDLTGIDWSRYTHIVMVGGNGALPEAQRDRMRQWIREEGGTLIAMRQSARWAQRALLGREAGDEEEDEGETPRLNYSQMGLRDAEHVIGGAVFATDLDPSHPLAYGYSDRFLPVHRNTSFTLEAPEDDPFAIVAQYTDEPLLSGYASERRLEEIAGTPAVIAERSGRGAVILFADNPNFRATYLGTEKLFLNSIFFSGLFSSARGEYEALDGHQH